MTTRKRFTYHYKDGSKLTLFNVEFRKAVKPAGDIKKPTSIEIFFDNMSSTKLVKYVEGLEELCGVVTRIDWSDA